jgi:PAS domain S-box-containing protein
MQHFYKRFSVTIGFLLLLILLIANAVLTRRELGVQVDDQAGVQHTQQVLLVASQTQTFLEDAETGQRGYLYTGDPRYLAPYDLAVTQLEPSVQQLMLLTADNPSQQLRAASLHTLAHDKMDELAQTILLNQEGHPDAAKALVLSGRGRLLMDDIRKQLAAISKAETSLQSTRASTYRSSVQRTIESIYFATVIAAFGLFLLAYYILNEINLRDRHANLLLEREEWFRSTLTSLGDAVITTDAKGRVTFLNPIAEHLIGTQLLHARGKPIAAVFPIFNESTHLPVDNPVKKVVELGLVIGLANHTLLQRTDGTFLPIEDSAAPIRNAYGKLVGVVLVFRDATNVRQSQELLRKTEKLAAAARIAATVSHEINNPLEAVGNLIYIVKTTPGMPPDAAALLAQAEQELDRVSHITRQTLGFYRESKLPEQVNLAELVESVLRIYSNKFRTKDIVVEQDIQTCPPIHGLPGELNQAIGNLISNAADAVPQGGTIRVEMACIDTADSKAVQISIQDNGSGISPENKEHIFEPFFTTKKDVGTGLGLWVTKEIVERHGGTIQVHPGRHPLIPGTVFSVLLPLDHKLYSPSPEA